MTEYDNKPGPGWLDFANPEFKSLLLTYTHVGELLGSNAPLEHWEILATVLVENHTPEQLANMLIGSCIVSARTIADHRKEPT